MYTFVKKTDFFTSVLMTGQISLLLNSLTSLFFITSLTISNFPNFRNVKKSITNAGILFFLHIYTALHDTCLEMKVCDDVS